MTSVVKLTRLFAEARDNRTKVSGTPNYDHIFTFKEDLLNVCLQIAFEGTNVGDPSVPILDYSRYQFDFLTTTTYDRHVAACVNCDPNLEADNPNCCAKEEKWVAITRNQSRKRAIKIGLVRPLKNETTFFTRVTPIEMLADLTKASGGLERVDTVDLFLDNLLAAITSSLLLKANSFPKYLPKWDGKIPEDQILKAWEDYFLP